MKGEQVMEEHDHKAQTCDMWGHVIKEPLPTKAGDRPKATPECDRGVASGHIYGRSDATAAGAHAFASAKSAKVFQMRRPGK